MTAEELAGHLNLTVCVNGDQSREVDGCYAGDLLSWVMGRAEPGNVWITIMSNRNVAAVALLADASCVILAEGVSPEPELAERAESEELAIFKSDLTTYELCGKIYGLLK